ncbi:MAG TPA: hypothetical protein VG818_06130, partial [Gemmatimonadaceae bacterium]|nr:hypothetical protein [Gemmatimonadaceae bacterium]
MKRHMLWASATVVAIGACTRPDAPVSPNSSPGAPAVRQIQDVAHGGTTPGFWFLPPMVSHPT